MLETNWRRQWLLIAAFGAAYALPATFVSHSYYLLILAVVPVWAVMGLSWNLLSGYSGFVSFGHAAFFGLGAYFVALAQIHWGLSPWLGIPCAGVVGAAAGVIVGLPTFRLRGHYFALAMLAYPLALLYVFEWLGYQELTLPMRREQAFAYMQFEDHRVYVWLAAALMVAAMLLTSVVERSRFGMSLLAIREDEAAAEAGQRAWKASLEKIYTWFPLLAQRSRALAGSLSGGQQQMLAIARGLASAPKLLMLDEPSMGLAPAAADEIFERLVAIHSGEGLTVLLVEQRVAEALHFADRGYVLEAGRIVLAGTHDELKSNDRIRQAYLGM